MRALIADKLSSRLADGLVAAGIEVISQPSLTAAALAGAIAEHRPEVLVVRSTRVDKAAIEASDSLDLIVRAGAGFNTIDLAAASGRGIFVANCPGMNAVAVAELTFAHLLNADRGLAEQVQALREGQWRKKASPQGKGLRGRTLGVLGCGAIGRAVIARARAFEMEVVAWSRSLTPAQAKALGVEALGSAAEVAERADFLTAHLALTKETRGSLGEALFSAMRPGAVFLNTSRGELVDEEALARAVRDKGIRAGLDVFVGEPEEDGPWTHPLAKEAGVYGSHHVGAKTLEAQEAVADETLRVILGWVRTGRAPSCVNLEERTPATYLLVVRHADEVGVLASVLSALREAGVNVQQMENVIFAGGQAACARIQLEGVFEGAPLEELRKHPAIYSAKVVSLGPVGSGAIAE